MNEERRNESSLPSFSKGEWGQRERRRFLFQARNRTPRASAYLGTPSCIVAPCRHVATLASPLRFPFPSFTRRCSIRLLGAAGILRKTKVIRLRLWKTVWGIRTSFRRVRKAVWIRRRLRRRTVWLLGLTTSRSFSLINSVHRYSTIVAVQRLFLSRIKRYSKWS